jgi:hypothetical protein
MRGLEKTIILPLSVNIYEEQLLHQDSRAKFIDINKSKKTVKF